jgi:FkbM family methyltransferase
MPVGAHTRTAWPATTFPAVSTPRSRPRALLVNAVQGALRRMGLELQPYIKGIPVQPREEDHRRVRLLASRGVNLVLDVGGNIGQYALRTRSAGYRGRIVSFEPLRSAYAELSARTATDPEWDCRRQALGSSPGEAEIHVSQNSYSSSLLEIEDRHLESAPESAYVGSESVSVVGLDEIWDDVVRPGERPYLKLDVQGFELEVLRGAERSLSKVIGVESELSLVPLYEGAPLHREVIDHLEAAGFRLAGLEPEFFDPETAELLQVQGIFVRE